MKEATDLLVEATSVIFEQPPQRISDNAIGAIIMFANYAAELTIVAESQGGEEFLQLHMWLCECQGHRRAQFPRDQLSEVLVLAHAVNNHLVWATLYPADSEKIELALMRAIDFDEDDLMAATDGSSSQLGMWISRLCEEFKLVYPVLMTCRDHGPTQAMQACALHLDVITSHCARA